MFVQVFYKENSRVCKHQKFEKRNRDVRTSRKGGYRFALEPYGRVRYVFVIGWLYYKYYTVFVRSSSLHQNVKKKRQREREKPCRFKGDLLKLFGKQSRDHYYGGRTFRPTRTAEIVVWRNFARSDRRNNRKNRERSVRITILTQLACKRNRLKRKACVTGVCRTMNGFPRTSNRFNRIIGHQRNAAETGSQTFSSNGNFCDSNCFFLLRVTLLSRT